MSKRPILFSGDMVRAILRGDKTQTRRVVKAHDAEPDRMIMLDMLLRNVVEWRPQDGRWFGLDGYETLAWADCPYGNPGDELWVRESFDIESFGAGVAQIRYKADNARGANQGVSDRKLPNRLGSVPSIHMPRHCSRIQLRITDVRVERVQDITPEDVMAEGCQLTKPELTVQFGVDVEARSIFAELWDSINGKPRADGVDISWSANPWVWIVEFERIKP